MKLRKISISAFNRNKSFWIQRQLQGEEMELLDRGKLAGILFGVPIAFKTDRAQELKRGNKIVIRARRKPNAKEISSNDALDRFLRKATPRKRN